MLTGPGGHRNPPPKHSATGRHRALHSLTSPISSRRSGNVGIPPQGIWFSSSGHLARRARTEEDDRMTEPHADHDMALDHSEHTVHTPHHHEDSGHDPHTAHDGHSGHAAHDGHSGHAGHGM